MTRMKMKKTMIGARVSIVAAALLLFCFCGRLIAQSGAPSREEERKLIGVLGKADATLFEKAKACQRLAVIGTRDAVPALAALLSDEKLGHYARYGLEPIPDPAADEALRAAMGSLKGKLLIGVINSIGVRRDAGALERLTQTIGDSDAGVAGAAAAAIGRIGTPEAARVLRRALDESPAAIRPAVADASLACGEALAAKGKREEAVALYGSLRAAKDLSPHFGIAAARGVILARGAEGAPLLVEALEGTDRGLFVMALGLARELPGGEVTRLLAARLGNSAPERRALLIQALGDRGDAAALPVIVEAVREGPAESRAAAVRALGKLGDASSLPVLLAAAVEPEAELAAAARESLAGLGGEKVDEAILARLDRPGNRERGLLIELAGSRRLAKAVPALRKAADDQDVGIRLAAIKALGETIELEEFGTLIARVVEPRSAEEASAAREALKAACIRMPDRDACAEKLLESVKPAPAAAKTMLLETFIAVGGAKALAAVSAAARDENVEIRDAAIGVLSEWGSEEAAGALLELARTAKEEAERLRALRGFSHFVRRLGFDRDRKMAACREALEISKTVQEKKTALEALAGIPTPETLALISPYLSDPDLREDASAVAVVIAERLARLRPASVRESMEQVLKATRNEDLQNRAKKLLEAAGRKKQ